MRPFLRRLILSLAAFGLLLAPAAPALAVAASAPGVSLSVYGSGGTSTVLPYGQNMAYLSWSNGLVNAGYPFLQMFDASSGTLIENVAQNSGYKAYGPIAGTRLYHMRACKTTSYADCVWSATVAVTANAGTGPAPTASPTARPTLTPGPTTAPSVSLSIGRSGGPVTAEIANGGSVSLYWSTPPSPYGYNVGVDETGGPYRAAQPGSSSLAIDSLATGTHTFKLSACSQNGPCLNSNAVTVTVDPPPPTPGCARNAPSLSAAPSGVPAAPGGAAQFNVTVTDNDSASCPAATYTLSLTRLPSGVTAPSLPALGPVSPGATGNQKTVSVSMPVGTGVPVGTYSLEFDVARQSGTGNTATNAAIAVLTVSGISKFAFTDMGASLSIAQGQGIHVNWSSAGLPVGGYFVLSGPNLLQNITSLPKKYVNGKGSDYFFTTTRPEITGIYTLSFTAYDSNGHPLLPATVWSKSITLTIVKQYDSALTAVSGKVMDSENNKGLQATVIQNEQYFGIDGSGNYASTIITPLDHSPISVEVSYPGYESKTVVITYTPATATTPAVYAADDTLLVKNQAPPCEMKVQLDVSDPAHVLTNTPGITPIGTTLTYNDEDKDGKASTGSIDVENGIPTSVCGNNSNIEVGDTMTISSSEVDLVIKTNADNDYLPKSVPISIAPLPSFVVTANGLAHVPATIVPNKITTIFGTIRDQNGNPLSAPVLATVRVELYDDSKATNGIWLSPYYPTSIPINDATGTFGGALPDQGSYTVIITSKIGKETKKINIQPGSNGPDDMTINTPGQSDSINLVVIPHGIDDNNIPIVGAIVTLTDKNGKKQVQKTAMQTGFDDTRISAANFSVKLLDYQNNLYKVSISAEGFQASLPIHDGSDVHHPGYIETLYSLVPNGDKDCLAKKAGTFRTIGGTTICFMDPGAIAMANDHKYDRVWQALGTEATKIQATTGNRLLADHVRIYGDNRDVQAHVSGYDIGKFWPIIYGGLIDENINTPEAAADFLRHESGHQFEDLVILSGYGGSLNGNLITLFRIRDNLYNDIKTYYPVIFNKEVDSLYSTSKPMGGHPWENALEDYASSVFFDNLYPDHYRSAFQLNVKSLSDYPQNVHTSYSAQKLMQSKIPLEDCFMHPSNIDKCRNLPN